MAVPNWAALVAAAACVKTKSTFLIMGRIIPLLNRYVLEKTVEVERCGLKKRIRNETSGSKMACFFRFHSCYTFTVKPVYQQ